MVVLLRLVRLTQMLGDMSAGSVVVLRACLDCSIGRGGPSPQLVARRRHAASKCSRTGSAGSLMEIASIPWEAVRVGSSIELVEACRVICLKLVGICGSHNASRSQ